MSDPLEHIAKVYSASLNETNTLDGALEGLRGVAYLGKLASLEGNAAAVAHLKSTSPFFRKVRDGLDKFIAQLENGELTDEDAKFFLPENRNILETNLLYPRESTSNENNRSEMSLEEAVRQYGDLLGDDNIRNALIHSRIICSRSGVVSQEEMNALKNLMEGKKYLTLAQIRERSGLSSAALYTSRKQSIMDEYLEDCPEIKGTLKIMRIERDKEDEFFEKLSIRLRRKRTKRSETEQATNNFNGASQKKTKEAKPNYKGVLQVGEIRALPSLGYDMQIKLKSNEEIAIYLENKTAPGKVIGNVNSHLRQVLAQAGYSGEVDKLKVYVENNSIIIAPSNERGRASADQKRIIQLYYHCLNREASRKNRK